MTTADLIAKYPRAYGKVYCGFYVEPGWLSILDELGAVMEQHGIAAAQVKEKFGGLRVYTDEAHAEVDAAIKAAESKAWKTCEVCGEPGKRVAVNGGGWVKTMCDEHAANWPPRSW
jgi:hypothetical protein